MFLYQAINQLLKNSERVLDLCAAPGGKSTLLTQYLPENCLLVSNEIIRQRSQILAENITKWGNSNVIVTNNSPEDFGKLINYFDAIVVDAPCSGEGMFRKDPNSINEWSVENVNICVNRQQSIIQDIWDAIKPDGILIYSTCTYNFEENEGNIQWICNELGADIIQLENTDQNILTSQWGYRFFPHRTKGEGFFMSALRKKSTEFSKRNLKTTVDKNLKKISSDNLKSTLKNAEKFSFYQNENNIFAFENIFTDDILYFRKNFNCLIAGLEIYEIKGKDLIPTTQLALSKELNRTNFEQVEVDLKTAQVYLKRESIVLSEAPKGFILITYKSLIIGWVKNIGNRCNNLYPQHWRIRMNL